MRQRLVMLLVVQGLPLLGFCAGVWLFLHEGIHIRDLGLLVGLYLLTMMGIEVGFHRYFAHRTFETGRFLRTVFLILGSMAGQGSALLWSAVHRTHHANSDQPGDPHSPVQGRHGAWSQLRGLFWSQFLWFLDLPGLGRFGKLLERHLASPADLLSSTDPAQEYRFARFLPDHLRDTPLVRLNRHYFVWVLVGFALPALLSGLGAGSTAGALRGLIWGGFVRYYLVQQAVYAVNSVGHRVGTRSMTRRDHSRNNAVMAVLTLGSGWHNNHHAFPGSARVDFQWWQVDPSGLLIRLLERMGLVWDVRVPSVRAIAARAMDAQPGISP
jgi:stearoyl-CoA desaturase (Delta-9 desaturase)